MPTVQMNVRIDARAKQNGNAVLAELGWTPSQLVRATWNYVGLFHEVPPDIAQMRDQETAGKDPHDALSSAQTDCQDPIGAFYHSFGIIETGHQELDFQALREAAAAERLESWEAVS